MGNSPYESPVGLTFRDNPFIAGRVNNLLAKPKKEVDSCVVSASTEAGVDEEKRRKICAADDCGRGYGEQMGIIKKWEDTYLYVAVSSRFFMESNDNG